VIGHSRGETRARLRLPGDYNVDNALIAFATAIGLGVEPEAAARGLAAVVRVPGRLERVEHGDGESDGPGEGIEVLVDYAHTPDALETVLTTVRGIVRGRLIAVFGCGGDRDQGKRPLMAAVGTRLADLSILTTDNPRSEDPEMILAHMVAGVADGSEHEVVIDRRAAIQRAIELAEPGDVVVIAGKGHETVQIVGDRRLPFDDREEAERALALRRVS
jgi:UDP-N-acetylmuramoyl-L-alanyl-D-glutamate--2,6-diaminopimelate ligase